VRASLAGSAAGAGGRCSSRRPVRRAEGPRSRRSARRVTLLLTERTRPRPRLRHRPRHRHRPRYRPRPRHRHRHKPRHRRQAQEWKAQGWKAWLCWGRRRSWVTEPRPSGSRPTPSSRTPTPSPRSSSSTLSPERAPPGALLPPEVRPRVPLPGIPPSRRGTPLNSSSSSSSPPSLPWTSIQSRTPGRSARGAKGTGLACGALVRAAPTPT